MKFEKMKMKKNNSFHWVMFLFLLYFKEVAPHWASYSYAIWGGSKIFLIRAWCNVLQKVWKQQLFYINWLEIIELSKDLWVIQSREELCHLRLIEKRFLSIKSKIIVIKGKL